MREKSTLNALFQAFLMSIARLLVEELRPTLRSSYVVVSELLPRFKASLGLNAKSQRPEPKAAEFYQKMKEQHFVSLHQNNYSVIRDQFVYYLCYINSAVKVEKYVACSFTSQLLADLAKIRMDI